MASYVVLTPPDADPNGEAAIFIRDGFTLTALVFPVFWFLWHRLWFWALGFVAIALATNMVTGYDNWFHIGLACSTCASFFAALEGQNLRVRRCEAKGFVVDAVVEADDVDTAEAIYFAARAGSEPVAAAPASAPAFTPRAQPPRGEPDNGIFDWYGAR